MTTDLQTFLSFSAIIAALVALGGVIWSNIKTSQRLERELRHDSDEKHRDRLAQLRRDVFLDLVAAQNNAGASLADLPNRDLVREAPAAALHDLMVASSKCQLIGSQETASLCVELQNAYAIALTRLLIAAQPIQNLSTDIRIADDLYKEAFQESQRILAQIKLENESGRPDPIRFDALQRAFEYSRELHEKYSSERSALWSQKLALQSEYVAATRTEIEPLVELQLNLARSLRDELGLPTNLEAFRARYAASRKHLFENVENFLQQISKT